MRRFYEGDDEDSGEDLSGFTVYDDEGHEAVEKKLKRETEDYVHFDESEQAQYFSPLPQNQVTAMLSRPLALPEGTPVRAVFAAGGGYVEYGGERMGDFKPALVLKLFETRRDQYAVASAAAGGLVRLEFFEQNVAGSEKLFR